MTGVDEQGTALREGEVEYEYEYENENENENENDYECGDLYDYNSCQRIDMSPRMSERGVSSPQLAPCGLYSIRMSCGSQ
jgi:hypothetical protein